MLRVCAKELGIQVISEGVETEGERDALVADGGYLMQGFLFAKPERGFVSLR
jgi:EAL domain-containing protein (putative c-di-GMP-specific phosphodiesterase class I)